MAPKDGGRTKVEDDDTDHEDDDHYPVPSATTGGPPAAPAAVTSDSSSSSSTTSAPSPWAFEGGIRTSAGAMVTAFEAPSSCSDKWALVVPTAYPPKEIVLLRDGGRCVDKDQNDCLPWKGRENYGFFSPALACPVGWTGQMTMQDGVYIKGGASRVASTESALPSLFPVSTLVAEETAVICCPPGFTMNEYAPSIACTATDSQRPTASPAVTCPAKSGALPFTSSPWFAGGPWGAGAFPTNMAVVKIAYHVEIHWRPEDLPDGQPPPIYTSVAPPSTLETPNPSANGESSGANQKLVTIAAVTSTLLGLLVLAICGFFILRRRRNRRATKSLNSDSTVPLQGTEEVSRSPSREMEQSTGYSTPVIATATPMLLMPQAVPRAHLAGPSAEAGMLRGGGGGGTSNSSEGDPLDPPPPYPAHEQSKSSGPPGYLNPNNNQLGGVPYRAPSPTPSRPLSMMSETTQDHALITDGWRV